MVTRQEYPKNMHHVSKDPVMVNSAKEQAALGPEWSERYIYQEYPKCKYHWTGKTTIVKNSDEEAALGGGWGGLEEFAPYRGPRPQRPEPHDLLKWVDKWLAPGLPDDQRKLIKAQLLRADGEFWRSPNHPDAGVESMRQAFKGIGKVLCEARILSEQLLQNEIPQLVWDSAIAAGWYRFASEVPKNIFPEQVGHYNVWRDGTRDWKALFHSETRELLADLLEAPIARRAGRTASDPSAKRKSDPSVQQLKMRVRKLRQEELSYKDICDRLGSNDRPPHAGWRDLPWPMAYKRHTSAVTKWLSDCR